MKDPESFLIHRRITQATNEWLESRKDESFLYPKTKLAEADVFAQKHRDVLSKDEIEFIVLISVQKAKFYKKLQLKLKN